jgi:hypothetical protein
VGHKSLRVFRCVWNHRIGFHGIEEPISVYGSTVGFRGVEQHISVCKEAQSRSVCGEDAIYLFKEVQSRLLWGRRTYFYV